MKSTKPMKTMKNESAISLQVTKGSSLSVKLYDEELGRMGSYYLQHTNHSKIRSNQRGISNMIIALVIEYGKVFYKQGYAFYVLGNKDLPKGIGKDLQEKIKNTVVVLGDESQIVTCYRGVNVLRHINRKQKYLAAA